MDKIITDFINSLVERSIQNPALAGKKPELENYFYRMSVETLIDHLNPEQFNQIKDLNPESPEALEKMQLFASQIRNFAAILDETLGEEAEKIFQSGQIPA